MTTKIKNFLQSFLKKELPNIRPGDTVRVYQKIKEADKERIQVFEGVVLARKHGKGIQATITIRKVISGIGVERVFPIHSPTIEKIEILKRAKVKRAKLYYLRKVKGKKAKLKKKEFAEVVVEEKTEKKETEKEKPKEEPVSAEAPAGKEKIKKEESK